MPAAGGAAAPGTAPLLCRQGRLGFASLGECLGSGKGPKCPVCGAGSAAPLPTGRSASFYLSCGLMHDVPPSSWT